MRSSLVALAALFVLGCGDVTTEECFCDNGVRGIDPDGGFRDGRADVDVQVRDARFDAPADVAEAGDAADARDTRDAADGG
jgi:hypothetical protein